MEEFCATLRVVALIHVNARLMGLGHGVDNGRHAARPAATAAPKVPTMPDTTAEDLRAMADWQRRWAELASSKVERRRRLEMAAYLERMAVERERGVTVGPRMLSTAVAGGTVKRK